MNRSENLKWNRGLLKSQRILRQFKAFLRQANYLRSMALMLHFGLCYLLSQHSNQSSQMFQ